MHYYTSDVDSWYSFAERQLLTAIAQAAPSIALHIHPDRWDAAREAPLGIARTPAIALYGPQQQDTGIRYYGMPDGYALETFLHTIRAVATETPTLQPATLAHVQQLTRPVHLEVLVSPT
jgi:hypothetical protein